VIVYYLWGAGAMTPRLPVCQLTSVRQSASTAQRWRGPGRACRVRHQARSRWMVTSHGYWSAGTRFRSADLRRQRCSCIVYAGSAAGNHDGTSVSAPATTARTPWQTAAHVPVQLWPSPAAFVSSTLHVAPVAHDSHTALLHTDSAGVVRADSVNRPMCLLGARRTPTYC